MQKIKYSVSNRLVLLLVIALLLSACGRLGGNNTPIATPVPTYSGSGPQEVIPETGLTITPSLQAATGLESGTTPTNPNVDNLNSTATAFASEKRSTQTGSAADNQPTVESTTPASRTAAPDNTPEATGSANVPMLTVNDQAIVDGMVKIDEVVSAGPGWIAIYSVVKGKPDKTIGYAQVHEGDNKNLIVPVEASEVTNRVLAVLHTDAGKPGVFEFPGPDAVVLSGVQVISDYIKNMTGEEATPGGNNPTETVIPQVTGSPPGTPAPTTQPSIQVEDQPIHNETVVIPSAYSQGESWLVIHPQYADGTLGNFIGFTLLQNGVNTNVRVKVDVTRTKPVLVAMLHVNLSKAEIPQYPGLDVPLMIDGKMVAPTFQVQGPLTGDFLLTSFQEDEGISHLADVFGMSLYLNQNDQPGRSTCAGECLGSFVPLTTKAGGAINAGENVAIEKIGIAPRADGSRQLTYGGAPLYVYLEDKKPGDTLGHGLDEAWFLVTP